MMSDRLALLALRLVRLWKERPEGVRRLEETLNKVADGRGPALSDDELAAMTDEIAHLEDIRAVGPFVAPVDRSILAETTPVIQS